MDFGKYIHELLLENEVVIVPGFGAFVSEYKPAEISDDSDEIKPPSKIVSFNQQIRNNDGLLVGLVAEKSRISHFDALKRIEKERENILYKLDSGEQVEVEEVGVLFYAEGNTIAFKAEEDENLLLDSFGLETTTIAVEEEPEKEVPVVVPPLNVKGNSEEVIVEEKHIEEKEPTEAPEQANEVIKEPEPVLITAPKLKQAVSVEKEPEEKKKKGGWLWLLLVLIPLIAVSVFIFMKNKKSEDPNTIEKDNTEIQIVEKPAVVFQDSTKIDSLQLDTIDSVKVIEQDSVEVVPGKQKLEINTETPKYYLVGGSFSVEENAETYLNELKAKGFDAFHVGKKGRFFIIGIATYDTFGQAEKAKKEYMTNNPGSEVWVYKK